MNEELKSLPVRERGLKYLANVVKQAANGVAPRAGAWIEIKFKRFFLSTHTVAPRAGAWIEIFIYLP